MESDEGSDELDQMGRRGEEAEQDSVSATQSETDAMEQSSGEAERADETVSATEKQQAHEQSTKGSGERDTSEDGSVAKDTRERPRAGREFRQSAGRLGAGQEEALDLSDAASRSDVVEQFDQLGELPQSDTAETGQTPELGSKSGTAYVTFVEQQLDGIEGDPAQLLQNRFKVEERRRQRPRHQGGRIYEHRPW
jgi:hypothetical protein